jgi:hypothetical protein
MEAATQGSTEGTKEMTTCDVWHRRDYLIRHGRTPTEPPCDHNPNDCPPTEGEQMSDRAARIAKAIQVAVEAAPPLPPHVIAALRDLLPPVKPRPSETAPPWAAPEAREQQAIAALHELGRGCGRRACAQCRGLAA